MPVLHGAGYNKAGRNDHISDRLLLSVYILFQLKSASI